MRRREFITGLGGAAAAWPLAAHAQQADRVRRIGVLAWGDGNDPVAEAFVFAFTQALVDLGWTNGRNVRMDLRWHGDDINRIGALAQELIGLQPDIILTAGTPATVAVQRETRTIPIVFSNVSEPVTTGIVARLDRPSGNITGFANFEATLGGKWLELLSEIAPGLKRAAIMFNPDTVTASAYMPSLETAARSLKVEPIIAHIHSEADIEAAIMALGREPGGGLVVMPDAYAAAIRIEQQRRHHDRIERRLAALARIAAADRGKVDILPHQVQHQAGEMVLGHKLLHHRRQKQRHSSIFQGRKVLLMSKDRI